MIRIKLPQTSNNIPRIVQCIDTKKVLDVGHSLNTIISVGYASMVNAATYFIVDYIAQIKKLPICRGKLNYYTNKTKIGIGNFEREFKSGFENIETWQRNTDLIDCIYEKIFPTCKCIYFALSNELGKKHADSKDRDMLSNMIVSAILLRQATTLFDEVLENARKETGYNFRQYFSHLSARCIEHPFGEAFMIVANAYGIDALALTNIEPVRIGINAIVNIMGDEKTYREAKESIENE